MSTTGLTKINDELLTHLFAGQAHLLVEPMTWWLASSRGFAAFVTTFRDKIRKKLWAVPDQESLLDLRLELESAYLLLQERSLQVVYEPQPPGKARGPDFAVSFTTSLTFMLEVTRLHAATSAATGNAPVERLADAIGGKLGQLLPQRSNVLLIGVEIAPPTPSELRSALLRLQQRAEQKDPAFFQRYHWQDRAAFFQHYQRLSEVLVRGPQGQPTAPLTVWVNPQAKQPLPSKVQTVLYRSQRGGG
jgi:hypothetical protein